MDRSKRRLARRLGGGLAALVVSSAGLTAAGAMASGAEQSKVLVAETITCGTSKSTTVDGVAFQLEPCVRRGPDMYGGGDAISAIANVTITEAPAQPLNVCRLTVRFRDAASGSWYPSVADCVGGAPGRVEGQQQFAPAAVMSGTTLVTVEFATVDGPLKVVSVRADFTGV
jgi:hypothetical protein